ncbi:hypothetical protein IYR97_24330 (plasmid) [Pseudomonas fulva]|uniref:Uncharacterized protein n=1 Tax=Pseudomonas fulva TaxID=47880 RepID=A0A7S9LMY7_9PSED|nr:hypothetical protein [Pseudomonas fulva]QPH46922.1 hypothetical protein IYR97_24330 [Pseudomonas fulva]QPH52097.1 hypothetical protein IZU98_24785 [Pseudomonas fulva]
MSIRQTTGDVKKIEGRLRFPDLASFLFVLGFVMALIGIFGGVLALHALSAFAFLSSLIVSILRKDLHMICLAFSFTIATALGVYQGMNPVEFKIPLVAHP